MSQSFRRCMRMLRSATTAVAGVTTLAWAVGVLVAVVVAVAVPNTATAQTRGAAPATGAPTGQPGPTLSVPGRDSDPTRTVPGTGTPGSPTVPPTRGGGSVDGLPDAVTVLDILRRLPRYLGLPPLPSSDEPPPPDRAPKPRGGTSVALPLAPPTPNRVVTLDPAQPFIPRPEPRAAAAPAAVLGAIVPQVRDREVIVTLAPGTSATTVYELGQDLGLEGETLYVSNLLGTRVVRYRIPDTRSIGDVVQQLAGDGRVQVAQPNYVFTANGAAKAPSSDTRLLPQYAPGKLNLEEAHRIAQGKRIKIAVIDTAIDTSHPALVGAVSGSFDALGGSTIEPELHGTAIAGIVGARTQLKGVAPEAILLGVRAFANDGQGTAQSHTLAILKGLDWAVLNGARVVNMSFAGPNDPLLEQAINAAYKLGVVIVAAAGNGGASAPPAYPGAYSNVITVTAIDDSDAIYKNANRGTYISVAAPGVDIIGAAPKGAYEMSTGTSMAAAHVSGVAALMLEKNPKLSPKDVRDGLAKSARQPPRMIAEEFGAGIVDAAEAVKAK